MNWATVSRRSAVSGDMPRTVSLLSTTMSAASSNDWRSSFAPQAPVVRSVRQCERALDQASRALAVPVEALTHGLALEVAGVDTLVDDGQLVGGQHLVVIDRGDVSAAASSVLL